MRAQHLIWLTLLGCDRIAGTVSYDLSAPDLECVRFSAPAHLEPVSLVILLEASDSMAAKWQPVTAALRAFLEDQASRGVSASLRYFPDSDACNAEVYATPSVDLRALPDLSFAVSLAAVTPGGSAPTLPAVQGAIRYARDQLAMVSQQRLAIVIVTDGDPDSCNSTADNVAQELAAAAIPSYFVTVAGDTEMQLDQIRSQLVRCSFAIPPAPMDVDYQAINVAETSLLPYDESCSQAGWHYDDPTQPKEIVICSCDVNATYDVLFGCPM